MSSCKLRNVSNYLWIKCLSVYDRSISSILNCWVQLPDVFANLPIASVAFPGKSVIKHYRYSRLFGTNSTYQTCDVTNTDVTQIYCCICCKFLHPLRWQIIIITKTFFLFADVGVASMAATGFERCNNNGCDPKSSLMIGGSGVLNQAAARPYRHEFQYQSAPHILIPIT